MIDMYYRVWSRYGWVLRNTQIQLLNPLYSHELIDSTTTVHLFTTLRLTRMSNI